MNRPLTVPMERVENRILSIRGHRVMLDADLAELYGVPTKALNQAIKRNAERFPDDFMSLQAREGRTGPSHPAESHANPSEQKGSIGSPLLWVGFSILCLCGREMS